MTDRFTLLSELGRGGMGVVWKARDEETGQIVALKLLREMYSEDPQFLARFERELELAQRIDSDHVVKVVGFGVRQTVPYLALEYIDGPSLQSAINGHGPYTWTEARALLIQLTQGLMDANAAGVIHRDVKPSNVLIGPDGMAKLTDLGIARGIDSTRLTATSTMLGTPAYMAPEGPKDARSDLYSLGIIGFELLTGSVPFTGHSYQDVIVDHMRTPPDLSRVPAEARPMIAWLLAKDPAWRPQSASELMPVLLGVAAPPVMPTVPGQYDPNWPGQGAGGPAYIYPRQRSAAPILAAVGLVATIIFVGAIVAVAVMARGKGASPTFNPGLAMATHTGTAATQAPTFGDGTAAPGVAGSSNTPPAGYSDGTWRTIQSLPHASFGGATVTLPDGRFMVIGGLESGASSNATTDVWIYDYRTSSWTTARPMYQARFFAAAAVLSDGSVLVAGGWASGHPTASSERYYPSTNTWIVTGSMARPRTEGAMVTLADGRAMDIGGGVAGGPGWEATETVEIFDPATNKWSDANSMSSARALETATVLKNGDVLVTGGASPFHTSSGVVIAGAEIFNPASGNWRVVKPLPVPMHTQAASLLLDGRVLVSGGYSSLSDTAPSLADAYIYDPVADVWFPTGSMRTARAQHRMLTLPDGRVLAAGGLDISGQLLTGTELFDPATGAWTPTGDLPVAVWWPAAAVLPDGTVLFAGGATNVDGTATTATCEIYSPPPPSH